MNASRSIASLLMAASWIGMILCVIYSLGVQEGGRALDSAALLDCKHLANSFDANTLNHSAAWTADISGRLWLSTALYLWPLWQLRTIGSRLLRWFERPAALAGALRWLGHSLVTCGLFHLTLQTPELSLVSGTPLVTLQSPGFTAFYLLAITIIGAYSLAWLIVEATQLRQENESFV